MRKLMLLSLRLSLCSYVFRKMYDFIIYINNYMQPTGKRLKKDRIETEQNESGRQLMEVAP